jgi:hypothetical protein
MVFHCLVEILPTSMEPEVWYRATEDNTLHLELHELKLLTHILPHLHEYIWASFFKHLYQIYPPPKISTAKLLSNFIPNHRLHKTVKIFPDVYRFKSVSRWKLFICQGLSDTTDLVQGLGFYIILAGSLRIYSWLGDELSNHVSRTDSLKFRYRLHYAGTAIKKRCILALISTGHIR